MQCHFCSEAPAGYTCPQCQAPYCSLRCYRTQAHGQCSESFYKTCVQQELKSLGGADKESKARMIETLQRVQRQEEEDEEMMGGGLDSDDEEDLAERLEGVDLDDSEKVWARLTSEERAQFEGLVENGEIERMLPAFEPFWNRFEEAKMVQEVLASKGERAKKEKEQRAELVARCPPIAKEIAEFSTLFRGEPSPGIKFSLLNVLYGYCYAARFFFGDFGARPVEGAKMLLGLSVVLQNPAASFSSADEALEAASAVAKLKPEFTLPAKAVSEVKRDVWKVVRGPGGARDRDFYLLSALSDAKSLIDRAVKEAKKKQKKGEEAAEPAEAGIFDRAEAKRAAKKLEFYLSWTKTYSREFDLVR